MTARVMATLPQLAVDAHFMGLALGLGRRGLGRTSPNPAVGALVVLFRDSGPIIVGRGWTRPGGRPHAETEALAHAGAAARGAVLYVSLEPCCHDGRTPPCTDAIIAAGIGTVVSAIEDPNPEVAGEGHAKLRAAGIEVRVGVMAEEAARVHAGHFRRIRDGRPHVTLKLAVSADGKVGRALPAPQRGDPVSTGSRRGPVAVTGERARDRVHLMRAMNDAVLIGIGTALADDPALTCRLPGMSDRSPIRVVLDSDLRMPLGSQLVQTARNVPLWVVSPASAADRQRALREAGVDVIHAESSARGRLDPCVVLRLLAQRDVTRLMIEGGPTVAAAWIAADLVDEIALFRSPLEIGPDGVEALEGLPVSALIEPRGLRSIALEPIGADTLETFVRE
jgi:diaminohydroxyphosphoribosylaminopyrimidine deaminase / 5-amino-6-(5-phosphoribosylamino)uracil reductase